MPLTISRAGADLPEGYELLRQIASDEGYNFVARLGARWRVGVYDIDDRATVRYAHNEGALIAIGAQTFDEYDPGPDQRRIRHFYVTSAARRGGVGRALANTLIQDAFAIAPKLTLRATYDRSKAFWESIGFTPVSNREDRTHEMLRP
ncbi:MAG: GNAT family N-acetyltransferase [Terricaulis sp.]